MEREEAKTKIGEAAAAITRLRQRLRLRRPRRDVIDHVIMRAATEAVAIIENITTVITIATEAAAIDARHQSRVVEYESVRDREAAAIVAKMAANESQSRLKIKNKMGK